MLWQDTSTSACDVLVMLSGYPTLASNLAADKAYVERGFMARMAAFVEHARLLQIEVDVNSLPIKAKVLRIETCSSAPVDNLGNEMVVEGVEIGKGGARQKAWLRFRGLSGQDFKQLDEENTDRFQTVSLRNLKFSVGRPLDCDA
jgi:hypothetical protein